MVNDESDSRITGVVILSIARNKIFIETSQRFFQDF